MVSQALVIAIHEIIFHALTVSASPQHPTHGISCFADIDWNGAAAYS